MKLKGQAPIHRSRVFAYQSNVSVRLSFKSITKKLFVFISKSFAKFVSVVQETIQNDKTTILSGSFIASLIKNWTSIKFIFFLSSKRSHLNLTVFGSKIFLF